MRFLNDREDLRFLSQFNFASLGQSEGVPLHVCVVHGVPFSNLLAHAQVFLVALGQCTVLKSVKSLCKRTCSNW